LKKLINLLAAAALSASVAGVATGTVDANPASARCRVIKGELDNVTPVHVSPPCFLDVAMYNGNLYGFTVAQRCSIYGGDSLGTEVLWGTTWPVCYGVDY